jgi:hypothetical protein
VCGTVQYVHTIAGIGKKRHLPRSIYARLASYAYGEKPSGWQSSATFLHFQSRFSLYIVQQDDDGAHPNSGPIR